jgi:hypothetical protein
MPQKQRARDTINHVVWGATVRLDVEVADTIFHFHLLLFPSQYKSYLQNLQNQSSNQSSILLHFINRFLFDRTYFDLYYQA